MHHVPLLNFKAHQSPNVLDKKSETCSTEKAWLLAQTGKPEFESLSSCIMSHLTSLNISFLLCRNGSSNCNYPMGLGGSDGHQDSDTPPPGTGPCIKGSFLLFKPLLLFQRNQAQCYKNQNTVDRDKKTLSIKGDPKVETDRIICQKGHPANKE